MDHFCYNLLQVTIFRKRCIIVYKVTIVNNIQVEKILDSLNKKVLKQGSIQITHSFKNKH